MKIKAKRDGKVVGTADLKKLWRSEWEIAYLEVEPQYRGKGVATELLESAKRVADDRELTLAALINPDGTGLNHDQMAAWLKRHGFKFEHFDLGGYTKPMRVYRGQLTPPRKD